MGDTPVGGAESGDTVNRSRLSRPARVLVVDDDPDFADLTAKYLERSDDPIEVETATSGEEGLARLEDGGFDCVVSDYDMPGMDGLAFLEAVNEGSLDVPFVLFTGKGSEEIASRAISAGVTDYLQKSGSSEQFERLANRVVHAARSRRVKSDAEATRAHLQTIVDSATDVVLTVDESSTIAFANRAVEDVFGYTPGEIEGEPLTMLMPERFRERHTEGIRRYIEEGERRVDWTWVEFPGLDREGNEIPLSISFGEFVRDGERYFTGIVRDVSEREERERELRAERSFTENALDALGEVFLVFDEDGTFLRWNERLNEVTGYTDEEIRSMRPVEFFADEDAGRVTAAIEECLRTGEATVEATVVTEDGERIPYEVRGRTLTGPDGERIGVAGIGRDVSERKARERELTDYETVVESLEDAVWMVDGAGTLTFVNGRVADQLSLAREALLGRHFTDVLRNVERVDPDVVEGFRADVEALLRGEREDVRREILLPRDGAGVVRDVRVVPVEMGDEIVGAVGVNRDITEKKRLRSELREVLGRVTDAFFALDDEWRFTYVNDRAEELLDRSSEELLGESVWEEFEAATELAFYDQYHRAMETQEPVVFEEFFPPLDTWFAVQAYPSETGLSVYFRDVTERKRREGRLAGLNEMLAAFLLVEGRAELCDVLVEEAADRLDLPVTAVALFDDEAGALEPAGRTPDAREHLDASGLLGRDGVAWESFTAGEPVVLEEPDPDLVGTLPVTHLLVYPLGRHGVLVTAVEAPNGPTKAEEDFVEAVVGNVKSALDRLEREASHREHEALLEEQNELLDRLNRVNDVIRRIDRGLVNAASRAEVERTVCEELVTAGRYRFAWVGEHDATTGRVEPGEYAGEERGFLDAVTVEVDGDASGSNPTARAARTGEPAVVEDVLAEPPLDPWRKAALDRGFRSCMAIPLVYRGRLYGVLTLYAEAPDSFDELEREVLAEFGTTIAHAMNSIESTRALVRDEVVELEFEVPSSELPLLEPLGRIPGCDVVLDEIVPATGGSYRVFFSLRNADGDVLERLEESPVVRGCTPIADREGVSVFECTVTDESVVAWLLDHGAVPLSLSLSLSADDSARLEVELSREADVRDFVELFRDRHPGTELLARRERERAVRSRAGFRSELEDRFTPRQREILRTAHLRGFFESPRRHTGGEIAASLGISQPTFSEHLRGALRKLLGELYGEAGGDERDGSDARDADGSRS